MAEHPEILTPTSCQAFLFDFDGTLVDSYPAITASVNHVRARRRLPPLSEPEVRQHVGRGPHYLLQHTVGTSSVEEAVAEYRAHHPSVMIQGTALLPGAAEIVEKLKKARGKIGLCSNKPRLFSQQLLESLGLASSFDVVLGPEDVTSPKPAPDMLIEAMHRLQVEPETTLYIGDMSVDIQTARAAGIRVWVVPTGSDSVSALELAQPDRLFPDLWELATFLDLG